MRQSLMIPLCSPEGYDLFRHSMGQMSFLQLVEYFVTQDNLTYCGPATASMMLNALGIVRPESPEHAPYQLFLQDSVFVGTNLGSATRDKVIQSGVSLDQFVHWLRRPSVRVTQVYASDSSLEAFRAAVCDSFADAPDAIRFLIANYDRKVMGQDGGGHISPIGLFQPDEDMVLILDVARYKYPPHWVRAEDLFLAMRAIDPESGLSRGWAMAQRSSVPLSRDCS